MSDPIGGGDFPRKKYGKTGGGDFKPPVVKNPYPVGSARWRAWQLNNGHTNTKPSTVPAPTTPSDTSKHNPYPVGSAQWRAWQLSGGQTQTKPSTMPSKGSRMTQDGKTYIFDGHGWRTSTSAPPASHAATPEGMRAFLIKKGYNIPAGNTALLRSAAADWRGTRNPSLWMQQNHLTATSGGKNVPLNSGGSTGGGGSYSGGGGAGGVTKLPALPDPNVNQTIDQSVLDGGAKPLPLSLAGDVAGLQFDPQIFDTKQQIQRQPYDTAQHIHDIGNWYGTVEKALQTAKGRNATAATDASNQIGTVAQGILASMGGNAAAGAGMVGAQGAADAATQAQLGANEQSYQNDLSPLLASEGAGAKTSETARGEALAQDLAHQLESLKGQRGQLKGQTELTLRGQNNDVANSHLTQLLNLLQYNNSARQQNLGNAQQAQALAQAAALNSAQVKYYNNSGTTANQFIPWMKLNPEQRQRLIAAGVGNVMDPNGGLMGNPQQARGKVLQYLSGQGYLSAAQPGTAPYNSMASLIDLAIQHAQGISKSNAAAAAAANG